MAERKKKTAKVESKAEKSAFGSALLETPVNELKGGRPKVKGWEPQYPSQDPQYRKMTNRLYALRKKLKMGLGKPEDEREIDDIMLAMRSIRDSAIRDARADITQEKRDADNDIVVRARELAALARVVLPAKHRSTGKVFVDSDAPVDPVAAAAMAAYAPQVRPQREPGVPLDPDEDLAARTGSLGWVHPSDRIAEELEALSVDEDRQKPLWLPQPGPQSVAAVCPVDITLFGGSRGGGKSDCAIGRQINGATRYGAAWNGLFLRKNFKHFAELRRRIDELITAGLPAIRVGGDGQTNRIKFANGAMILLTAIEREEQLEFFQGQQFTEISIEEGCQFQFFDAMVEKLKGCMRSPHGVPCRMFITANPGGPGHNQVKARFRLGRASNWPAGRVIEDSSGETMVFIPSSVNDNLILCQNDPKYVNKLRSIKDPKLRAAWLDGDWDVVAGGFFDDVWDSETHVLNRFKIPDHWDRIVGIDWGSAKPFSVGWYAVSGGEYLPEIRRTFPRGTIIRYREWYGCVKDTPNTGLRLESGLVAQKILDLNERYDESHLIFDYIIDPATFKQDDGPSIAEKMAEAGVVARKADNKRITGWDECRARLRGSNGVPHFYVFDTCVHFIRTIPILSRDEVDWDDLDTDQEDHVADEWRYTMMSRPGDGTSMLDVTPDKVACEADHDEIIAEAYEDALPMAGDDPGLPCLNLEEAEDVRGRFLQ